MGVEVAPQMPTLSTPVNHSLRSSSASEIKKDLGFTASQTLNNALPLELFFPLTNKITSCCDANCSSCGSRLETWRHNVSFASKTSSAGSDDLTLILLSINSFILVKPLVLLVV